MNRFTARRLTVLCGALALSALLAAPVPARADGGNPTIQVEARVQAAADGSMQIHYERSYSNDTDQVIPIHELVRMPARDGRGTEHAEAKVIEATNVAARLSTAGVQTNLNLAAHSKAKLAVDFSLPAQSDVAHQGLVWAIETGLLPAQVHVQVSPPAGAKLAPDVDVAQTVNGLDSQGLANANGLLVRGMQGGNAVAPAPLTNGAGWEVAATSGGAGGTLTLLYAREHPDNAKAVTPPAATAGKAPAATPAGSAPQPWTVGQVIFWVGTGLIVLGAGVGIAYSIRRERREKVRLAAARKQQRQHGPKR